MIIIILKWMKEELWKMDKVTKKIMAMHKALNPSDDTVYTSIKEGRGGFTSIQDTVDASILWIEDFIKNALRKTDFSDQKLYRDSVDALGKRLENLKIRGQLVAVQTTAFLRSAKILRKVLETWGHLLTLRLSRNIIS